MIYTSELPGRIVDPSCPIEWAHPLCKGIVFWWLCVPNPGWTKGTVTRDLVQGSRYPRHLVLNGTALPTWKSTNLRSGGYGDLNFDSANNQAAYLTGTSPVLDAPFTMAGWVKVTSLANGQVYFSLNDSTSSTKTANLNARATGALRGNFHNGTTSTTATTTVTPITVGTWHHGLFSCLSATSRTIYVNGGFGITNTTSSAGPVSFDRVTIGANGLSSIVYMPGGAADDCVLWGGRALSEGETYKWFESSRKGHPEVLRWVSRSSWFPPIVTGGGITENLTPVAATCSVVAPTVSLSQPLTPVVIVGGVVAPTMSLNHTITPVNIPTLAIEPTLILNNSPSPVTITGSGIAPSSSVALGISPTSFASSAVTTDPNIGIGGGPVSSSGSIEAVTLSLNNTPSPVIAVFTIPAVSTGGETFVDLDPVSITLSVVNTTNSVGQTLTPPTTTITGVTPNTSLNSTVTPVSMVGTVPTVTQSIGLEVTAVSSAFSIPTVEVARVETPTPVTFAGTAVSVTTALNNTLSPVVGIFSVVVPNVIGGDIVSGPYYIDACQVYSPGYVALQVLTPGPTAVQVNEV